MKRPEVGALAAVADRFGLDPEAETKLGRLLEALAHEPAPPTAVTDPDEALRAHVADSLSGLELTELAGARAIADLGAGAGFPGLPLAIALPHARVDLIESTGSKCAVIERLATAAGVGNARAVAVRAEDWGRAEGDTGRGVYDAVAARALAGLPVLVEYAAPLLRDGGALVAWKGIRSPEEEGAGVAAAARVGLELDQVLAVTPFEGALDRHLHVYLKTAGTPDRFPRRPGMAAKRPLA